MNYQNDSDRQPLNANQYAYNPDQPVNPPHGVDAYQPVNPYPNQPANPYPNQYGAQPNAQQPNPYYAAPAQATPVPPTDPFEKDIENDGSDMYMTDIRRGFVKKVYGILSATLLFTALICVWPVASKPMADYLQRNIWILITFSVLSFVPLYMLFCCIQNARKVPLNYILLFSFVFWESVVVAYCWASVNDPKIVMIAAMMTLGLTIILTAYACTTKVDFTICYGLLFVLAGALLMWGLMAIILRSDLLYLFYCMIGVVVYGVYLIIDTQLVWGGHTWQLSEDDYVIGALILYMDIIILFIKILSILSRK